MALWAACGGDASFQRPRERPTVHTLLLLQSSASSAASAVSLLFLRFFREFRDSLPVARSTPTRDQRQELPLFTDQSDSTDHPDRFHRHPDLRVAVTLPAMGRHRPLPVDSHRAAFVSVMLHGQKRCAVAGTVQGKDPGWNRPMPAHLRQTSGQTSSLCPVATPERRDRAIRSRQRGHSALNGHTERSG
jgi:hypothetical protein